MVTVMVIVVLMAVIEAKLSRWEPPLPAARRA